MLLILMFLPAGLFGNWEIGVPSSLRRNWIASRERQSRYSDSS